jgi:hypothetical protein
MARSICPSFPQQHLDEHHLPLHHVLSLAHRSPIRKSEHYAGRNILLSILPPCSRTGVCLRRKEDRINKMDYAVSRGP